MADMKLHTDEKKDFCTPCTGAPSYPYGLEISLGSDELKKLGVMKLPEINSKMKMVAIVEVIEVSSKDHGEGKEPNVRLQIIDMELSAKEESNITDHQVIYGE